jgi:hypothetical protein
MKQKQNDLPESTPIATIQQLKSFKFSPAVVGIKYTQMNVMGVPKQGSPVEPRSYQTIALANIPLHGDRGISPNPTKPWLEMSTWETEVK